jgi:FtsH-binding integral membrane protein
MPVYCWLPCNLYWHWSYCAFLLALGISSIYVSRLPYPRVVLFFSVLYSGVWVARAIMEIRYPVRLKLFFLNNPTSVLLPVISIIALIYLTATLASIKSQNQKISKSAIS